MQLSDAGYIALILALGAALYGSAASVLGARLSIAPLTASGRNAIYVVALLLVMTASILVYSFVAQDFGLRYVTLHSSTTMPWYYILSAFYAGQEGSLLYWSTLLAVFGSVMILVMRRRYPALMGYANAVILANLSFFLIVLVFFANPMARLPATMPDGVGLNPLLQDPGMLVHPPMLLAGYMSWTLPFAIGIGRSGDRSGGSGVDSSAADADSDCLEHSDRGAHPRRLVGVPRAGLGRVLGLGPGRECRVLAVAYRYRIPPFGHGC